MVFAVPQFNGPNVALFRVESEVVIETPPIIAEAFFDLKAGCNLVVVARHVRDLDARQEVRFTVGVKGFREHPCELEPCLNDDNGFVALFQIHCRIQIGNGNVGGTGRHNGARQPVRTLSKGYEERRFIVVKVATKGHLDVLDILPSVNVTELDLCGVGNSGVQRCVIIVTENG